MKKLAAKIMLASSIFFTASMVCCEVPSIKDEEMRQRGWSDVEHPFAVWDYSGIFFFCAAGDIILAGI